MGPSKEARKPNVFFAECTIGRITNLAWSSRLKDANKDPAWCVFGDKQDDSATNKTITKLGRGAKQVEYRMKSRRKIARRTTGAKILNTKY